MEPEPSLSPSSADLLARQYRLELQLADVLSRLSNLERYLAVPATPAPATASVPPPPPLAAPLLPPASPAITPPPPRASLENRLGSQIFNRIGIVAILIGATWFLKLAVDKQWIGPTDRVLIGLLAGAALVLWSERFRRKGFPAFSYSLKAIGTGVLYLSLWASFQLYHLLPASVALVAMLLVTAWNAWMAWSQDAELLAAYALAGGLSTPLLLSTGGNHQLFLFTYVLSIDIAVVGLARIKSWPRLLPGALLSTAAYFIGWYSSFYTPSQLPLTVTFILLFSAVFASPPFAAADTPTLSRREQLRVLLRDIVLPLGTASFAALALYSVLEDAGHRPLVAWVMLALSAIYLALMRLPQSQLASAIHLSLAVVFLTVAIPLKATGHWIVISWLVEGVALLWASTRAFEPSAPTLSSGRFTLLLLASASLTLGFFGTLWQLFPLNFVSPGRPVPAAFLNGGFATALIALATFAAGFVVVHRSGGSALDPHAGLSRAISAVLLVVFNLVAVVSIVVQINLFFRDLSGNTDVALQRALAVSAFLMLYGAALLAVGFWKRSSFVRWQALLLLVFTIAKTFLYDMRNLSQVYRVLSFVGLGALLMAVSFAYQKDWLALRDAAAPSPQPKASE